MDKSIFQSKTFWVNAITVAVAALAAVAGTEQIQQNPQVAAWLTAGVGVLNIVLRTITTVPVTMWFGKRG